MFLTQPLAANAAIAWSPAVDVARYSWHVRPHEGDLSEQLRGICGDICWDPHGQRTVCKLEHGPFSALTYRF